MLFFVFDEFRFKDEDSRLVNEFLSGKAAAFDEIYKKYEKLVFNIAIQLLKNREDAEECLNDTFMKVYKNLSAYRGDCTLSVWIYRIAENTALDALKSRDKREFSSLEDDDEVPASTDEKINPEKYIEIEENKKLIRAAIAALNERERVIITLCDIEGLSYEEISDALNINIGTVSSRISRAREKIKKYILKHGNL